MPMEQTAKAITPGYTGAALKRGIFLISAAKLPKTARKNNTQREKWYGNPQTINIIVKL